MPGLVEVAPRVADATAEQRATTEDALRAGTPGMAATPEQRRRRKEYLHEKWPELARVVDVIPEGRLGRDDTLYSNFLARGARCARAVARVVWKDEPSQTRWNGTAFLISDWVALTNRHVLESVEDAELSALEFDYEFDEWRRERRPKVLPLDPRRLFLAHRRDPELDYSVVAVGAGRNGAPPGKGRGYLPLIERTGKAQNGDPLNLIHHPAGDRKRITVRESRLLAQDDYTLHYSGDTLGGSSGSAVLNDQWEVVGLHFGGRPKLDAQGRRLSIHGTLWDPSMPAEEIAYDFNVATRISKLVQDIRERAEGLQAGRELLMEALGGTQ